MGLFQNLTGWHFLILLVVVLLIWGSTKLPALAKSIGQSTKILRNELRNDDVPPADAHRTEPTEPREPGTTTDQR